MNKYLCLSTSDIHGNITQYEKIKQVVIEQKVSFVFFSGDMLPKRGGLWHPENKIRTIQMQKDFINGYFLDYLKELSKYAYVYAISGNDDFKSNYHLFSNINNKVTFLENQVVCLPTSEELYVAGYPYISITPFLQKDWEKWDAPDDVLEHKILMLQGFTSRNDKHYPIDFENHKDDRTTIAEDLELLVQKSDPKKTVYIFHEPPYNTPLDVIAKDNKFIKGDKIHIGSKAIRKFIEEKHPLLTTHGHIHETFQQSGEYKWKSGSSTAITASNDFLHDPVAYVLFRLPKVDTTERIIL